MFIVMYLVAIIAANLSVATFGPSAVVVNSFVFIALDLVSRDRLHDRWQGRGLPWRMAALIAAGSVLSWALNRNAGPIALASFVAFAAAATVDTLTYAALSNRPWFIRVNGSNVPAAIVDSAVFLSLAGLPLLLLPLQVVAKISGGVVWSWILTQRRLGEAGR
jgi:uncharacterized PurR-regulated membrane protein YhhQ (DUF165 family)